MSDNDGKSIGAKVDPDVKQRIRVAAAQKGMSMSEYIRRAVMQQLESDEGNAIQVQQTAD